MTDRKDFRKWFEFLPHWPEVAFRHRTGKPGYQHPQDLAALFWNGFVGIEMRFETYYKEFQTVPSDFFNDLIYRFRQDFPKNGRVDGVNYFDDLLEMLLEKYNSMATDTGKEPPKYSVPTVAMALILKGITINKKGLGVTDNIDYTKKFNIRSQNTLYLSWLNLSKDPTAQKNYQEKATALIKNEGL